MIMDLYEVLGLHRKASSRLLKSKFNDLAKKHHPDKGGDEAVFQKISHAYSILKDDKKRAYYDDHGAEKPKEDPITSKALGLFYSMVERHIEALDGQIITLMSDALKDQLRRLESERKDLKTKLMFIEEKHISFKKNLMFKGVHCKVNMFENVTNNIISNLKGNIENLDNQEKVLRLVQDYISDFEYDHEPDLVLDINLRDAMSAMKMKYPEMFTKTSST